uniref:F-box domain-containing protein n=1 Tax=Psilocybe cubensis TaxID=181762 RepID=A0A8H8CHV4_PSICU
MRDVSSKGHKLGATRTTPPKIFRLPNEILLYIFSLNARPYIDLCQDPDGEPRVVMFHDDFDSKGPLLPTRRASQVCRLWRNVILASPALWANALDLNFMMEEEDNWRNEGLKRTGQSPLTVIAEIDLGVPGNRFPYSFLFEILDNHWHRVKTFFVGICTFSESDTVTSVKDAIWNALNRPAPALQFCSVIDLDTVKHSPDTPLFSGQAPQLRSLVLQGFRVKLSGGRWLSNLRRLFLQSCDAFPADVVLQALSEMHLLEDLVLEMDPSPHIEGISELTVELPHLENITIFQSITWLSYLVKSIVPKQGCRFTHTMSSDVNLPAKLDSIDGQGKAYASFLQKYSNTSDIVSISYTLSLDNAGIPGILVKGFIPDNPVLEQETERIVIEYQFNHDFTQWTRTQLPHLAADALAGCDLHNVTTFQLILKGKLEENARITDDTIVAFALFVRALPLVDFLHCNSFALILLLFAQALFRDSAIFPELKTIRLERQEFTTALLAEYITRRRNAGGSVETICLVGNGGSKLEDVSSTVNELEELLGVAVIWEGPIADEKDDDDETDEDEDDNQEDRV